MKKLFIVMVAVFPIIVFGQGLDNRAVISSTGNVFIIIDGATGNFKNDAQPGSHIEVLTPGLTMYVDGNWTNNNTLNVFSNSGSTVRFEGATQIIGGTNTTTFDNVVISGAGVKYLAVDIGVTNTMTMSVGTVELDGNDINFSSTGTLSGETNSTYVFEDAIGGTGGLLKSVRTLNAPAAVNVAGLGYVLTTGLNLGSTIVERGHQQQTGTGLDSQSIFRWYAIVPTNTADLNATVLIQYLDHELNGPEANLEMWYSADLGSTWTATQPSIADSSNNWVVHNGIDLLTGWWTLSDSIKNPASIDPVGSVGTYSGQALWPNCNKGNFSLRFSDDASTNVIMTIFDSFGKQVWQQTETATGSDRIVSFNLREQLAPGMYYLQIQGKKANHMLKVCVEE